MKPSLHTCECEVDFSTRSLGGLLHEGADHNELLSMRRKIDRTGNAVLSVHPYFPEFALQVVNMRFLHRLRAKIFEHLCNAQKVGAHVIWQALYFRFCPVGQFYVPAHRRLYLF